MNPTCVLTPAASAASVIARASSTVVARGFSQWTCLPAAMAASDISLCSALGVVTWITSISGTSIMVRQSVVQCAKPMVSAAVVASSSVMSATV